MTEIFFNDKHLFLNHSNIKVTINTEKKQFSMPEV